MNILNSKPVNQEINLHGLEKIISMSKEELEDFFEKSSIKETAEVLAKILLVKEDIEKEIRKVSDDLNTSLSKTNSKGQRIKKIGEKLIHVDQELEQGMAKIIDKIQAYVVQILKKKKEKSLEKKKENFETLIRESIDIENALAADSTSNMEDLGRLKKLRNGISINSDNMTKVINDLRKEIKLIKKNEKYHEYFPTEEEIFTIDDNLRTFVKKTKKLVKKDIKYINQDLLDDMHRLLAKADELLVGENFNYKERKNLGFQINEIYANAYDKISKAKIKEKKKIQEEKNKAKDNDNQERKNVIDKEKQLQDNLSALTALGANIQKIIQDKKKKENI